MTGRTTLDVWGGGEGIKIMRGRSYVWGNQLDDNYMCFFCDNFIILAKNSRPNCSIFGLISAKATI